MTTVPRDDLVASYIGEHHLLEESGDVSPKAGSLPNPISVEEESGIDLPQTTKSNRRKAAGSPKR